MRLSSLADYAVVMMTAAAREGAGGRSNATLLAGQTGVPLPTAQKLVSRLAGAGLIESTRGTGGGIRLARDADTISLADIVEAVDGPIALTACVDGAAHECGLEMQCRVRPHWHVVNQAVRAAFSGVTLATLAADPVKSQVMGASSRPGVFA
ncbi:MULTISPECIES: SUF system Fe-S cluster assembly regulator [Sphingomonas]|uniref:SUF system Fe-S cluster assembly regulator n=1 Tax=Sphingomonas zeae TaxID=1646122 RepID=A0A7Y6B5U3_9SPHN|nr:MULTISPECIES: SUF system Fe-S cluster assembly regulator [Sphingomonas]MBB4048603.1 FeS assembly SUF system regulator [Sphingomonas zeae]MDK8186503.1 SUF system Fe-S cluster assembly regulator [Sphingomonas zeae]MDK8216162.1 SUF system Fe-S cluster assembly regulator [Sphingomonas sp. UMB7805-LC452B]NUU47965.1 SUF system Fe-S cluster assembly regulator [Sphingomonas zeae]